MKSNAKNTFFHWLCIHASLVIQIRITNRFRNTMFWYIALTIYSNLAVRSIYDKIYLHQVQISRKNVGTFCIYRCIIMEVQSQLFQVCMSVPIKMFYIFPSSPILPCKAWSNSVCNDLWHKCDRKIRNSAIIKRNKCICMQSFFWETNIDTEYWRRFLKVS